MTESIQNQFVENETVRDGAVGTTLCAQRSTPARSDQELDFWRFAAEQYGIWIDDDEWCELALLDDHLLIARRYFWRLSDPEVHELLSAVPDAAE
jgi:hypothetical protein